MRRYVLALLLLLMAASPIAANDPLRVLFLGDDGPHRPRERFPQLALAFRDRGIDLEYTDRLEAISAPALAPFDAVMLYANIDRIERTQEQALLDYVANGGGFVPIHCATYCFRNSPDLVALMGGQFQSHGAGVFRTRISRPEHPLMEGFEGFESWDETYVHHLHNEQNRTVLAYREEGAHREPWTWIRTHGRGRVFYTAWGHDHRTWRNPGFHNLVERGVRWAAGGDLSVVPPFRGDAPFPVPRLTPPREDVEPFAYVDVGARIPNYTPDDKWGTQGKPHSRMQAPLPPDESLKHIRLPEGFHAELFVSEPDLQGKPIAMNWDERARLWVAETVDYPNELQPPGEGRDRIRICEDTNGDGRADKFTVFAEGLSIPTAITFHRGGAIIQDSTRTLYLKDTDGDDVADHQEVLFTGWNQGDTHGGVSNFQYGLDNWVWAMQGYNKSRPRFNLSNQDGEQHPGFGQGFFRFRPDGTELEFVRSTNNNTWGLGISEEGLIFGSTANRNPSVFMAIANRYYERVRGWTPSLQLGSIADSHRFAPVTHRVRQVDHHGGYTAGAGHALYTARSYPRAYWNRTAFVAGPTGHLVGTFVLKPDGSGFRSSSPCNLLASDDEWTAPIMAEVGPDGYVWVIDWYNYIVQHNPTPEGFENGKGNAYVSDLRDKKHGRIYRVVHGVANQRRSLAAASPLELVAALADSNRFWRRHAQRLLVERAELDVVPDLLALARDTAVDAIGLNVGAIHALWTLRGLGVLDGTSDEATDVAIAALVHPSPGVRLNALRVLPPIERSTREIVAARSLLDPDPQVRLAACLALADLPPAPEAAPQLVSLLAASSGDRWCHDAATVAAATNPIAFLSETAPSAPAGSVSSTVTQVVTIVARHVARGEDRGKVAPLIERWSACDPDAAAAAVRGLIEGWPEQAPLRLEQSQEDQLETLLTRLPSASRGDLVKLGRRWGSDRLAQFASEIANDLFSTLANSSQPVPARVQAARQIIEFAGDDPQIVQRLLGQLTPKMPPELVVGIIAAVAGSDRDATGRELVEAARALSPAARQMAIQVLLGRRGFTAAVLNGVEQGHIQLAELTLAQQRSLAQHPDAAVRDRARDLLARGGALPSPDRQRVLARLMPLTERRGRVAEGKQVFTKHCSNCHVHSGEGVRIGPDLTSMAVHSKQELLTHVIDPSRSVEGNFRLYTVITADGKQLNGMLAAETATAVELIDTTGKKTTILREAVEQFVASTKSVMPDGFETHISPTQLGDLLEFLTHRGRFVPVDIRQAATISSAQGMFNDSQNQVERLIFSDWSPKRVGDVPFVLIDPQAGQVANVILLHGPNGAVCREMPRRVTVPVRGPAAKIHLLSGVSGWGFPLGDEGTRSMELRITYEDGTSEGHDLLNGVHFADYIRRTDVPESEFAFALRDQQIRYLAIQPRLAKPVRHLEFVKGEDRTAPVVMAVTIETE